MILEDIRERDEREKMLCCESGAVLPDEFVVPCDDYAELSITWVAAGDGEVEQVGEESVMIILWYFYLISNQS